MLHLSYELIINLVQLTKQYPSAKKRAHKLTALQH